MSNRLNGWQRIGIVLTGLWLAFVALLGVQSFLDTGPFGTKISGKYRTEWTQPVCSEPTPPRAPGSKQVITLEEAYGECAAGTTISPASQRVVQVVPPRHPFKWDEFLAALVIPPFLVWLLFYGVVAVFKWVAKGFRPSASSD